MLNDLYFKTTCNIRPHFLGPMGGLKIEGPLYAIYGTTSVKWLNYPNPPLQEILLLFGSPPTPLTRKVVLAFKTQHDSELENIEHFQVLV